MSGTSTWARDESALWRSSGGSIVLKRVEDDPIFTLGATGLALWVQLAHPTTLDALAAQLASIFDAPLQTVRADLKAVLEVLEGRGLVRRVVSA